MEGKVYKELIFSLRILKKRITMENNKYVVFLGLFILLAIVISVFNEYDITGLIARGGPGNLPRTGPGVGPTFQAETKVGITNAGCEWTGSTFWACATVEWAGLSDFYSKAFISGGESLSKSHKQDKSPYIYCQDVGNTGGKRSVQAYLYGTDDGYRNVDGATMDCVKNLDKSNIQEVKFSFRARTFGPKDAAGTEIAELKGKPLSCDYTGYYTVLEKRNVGCYGGTGILRGHIDPGMQYVYMNPGPFDWKEMGSVLDPAESYHEGYAVYATSCDPVNYFDGENYVRGKAKLMDEGVQFDWEYFNKDTKPNIDFILNLKCKILAKEKENIIAMLTPEPKKPLEEAPNVVKKEANGELEIQEAPINVWGSLKRWFLGLF